MLASGLNPADAKAAAGGRGADPDKLPLRLGFEAAGTIIAVGADGLVGADGAPIRVGDEVLAFRVPGAHASELTVAAKDVLQRPPLLEPAGAAGLLLVSTTAAHGLDVIRLGGGETLLVHGGAGSVGLAVIQLAKRLGAHVIATAAAHRFGALRALGAEPVAYGPGLEDRVRAMADRVDAAYDTVGTPEALEVSVALVADPGRIVSIANKVGVQDGGGIAIGSGTPHPGTEFRDAARAELVRLAGAGELVIPVVARFPLAEARAAFEFLAGGHAGGKVVLEP